MNFSELRSYLTLGTNFQSDFEMLFCNVCVVKSRFYEFSRQETKSGFHIEIIVSLMDGF